MKEETFLSFSSVIASVLLYKKCVSSIQIINFISDLVRENIYVDDEIDNEMDNLLLCIDYSDYDSFKLKNGFNYDTFLSVGGVTVKDYLISKSDAKVLEYIEKKKYFEDKTCVAVKVRT